MSEEIKPEDIELPANQKEVLEMFCQDLTEVEISIRLSVSRTTVLNRFKLAMNTLGVTELLRRYGHIRIREKVKTQRENSPQDVCDEPGYILKERKKRYKADAEELRKAQTKKAKNTVAQRHVNMQNEIDIIESGDAEAAVLKLLSLAKQSGLPATLIDAIGARIHRGLVEVDMMPENYKDDDLRIELHKKIRLVLGHIDTATVGGAKLTDLAAMYKTLQEQAQLLDGRPTAILSVEDKGNLSEIAERMQAEMRRREKVINGSCEEVQEKD